MRLKIKNGLGRLSGRTSVGTVATMLLAAVILAACSDNAEPISEPEAVEGEITDTPCEYDSECNDGVFCNGQESCDGGLCRTGVTVVCDDKIDCTVDHCSHASNSCQFTAPDEDADNHADAACIGADGDALGDDCDDNDPDRYPGNQEVCSSDEPDHDEDCDPLSFGKRDDDFDGETSSACCNEDEDGEAQCGSDCDDSDYRVSSDYPEICDDLDNDCDGKVDKNTKEVPWYPDSDGDHFGDASGESILSCAPVDGYSLRPTDCDDSTGAVNHAAREVCDGVDNDCDGDIDEDGVCSCAPEGNVRPCVCGPGASGVQSCESGLWNSCDCSECDTGATDCVGELLPRVCQAGRWTTLRACSGLRPICLDGACRCADGSDDCVDVLDVFVPRLLTTSPLEGDVVSPQLILAAEMSEEVSLLSARSALSLKDAFGQVVMGTVGVSGTTVSFMPNAALAPGMFYRFTIENTLEDLAGNAMAVTQGITFQTESGLAVTRVSNHPTTRYTRPQLAMSPAGKNLLLVEPLSQLALNSLTWDGATWNPIAQVLDSPQQVSLTVDDEGRGVSLFLYAASTQRQLINAGQVTLQEGLTGTRSDVYGALSTGAGGAVVLYEADEELKLQTGTTSGSWNSQISVPNSQVPLSAWAFGASRKGHGCLVYQNENGPQTYRSSEDFSGWISGAANGSISGADFMSVAVSDLGVATIAWTKFVNTGSGFQSQIFLRDLSQAGVWLASTSGTAGSPMPRNEVTPQLAYDGAGNLFVAFIVDNSLIVKRRNSAGVWATERVASSLGSSSITQMELHASTTEGATVVWLQKTQRPDLWGIRYSAVGGWGNSRLLEELPTNIELFDSALQSDDTALVVFSSAADGESIDLYSLEF